MNTKTALLLFCLIVGYAESMISQEHKIWRVEPANWWTNMRLSNIQIMVYGQQIGLSRVEMQPYQGVILKNVHKAESPNYLFLDVEISSEALAGTVLFSIGDETLEWNLYPRDVNSRFRKGFDASDVVYLLFPDRFCNGDPTNDFITEMGDKLDRKDLYKRHGGDIQGIINQLDYLENLGITALWINPLLENKQEAFSYHGYAITDFYKVDPRFGTNELYCQMVEKASRKGIKVIMDMIFNHCGDKHWWMKDLPFNDWIHQWPNFVRSNYRATAKMDPHVSKYDLKRMSEGWFDVSMPDLNQQNPFLANYLIQNSIWWVEYANLSGIRMDTYPYSDKAFMARWAKTVMDEYPNFNIVGETWMNYPAWVAYWQENAPNLDGYNSHLPTVMDFPLMYAMGRAFDEEHGWDTGLSRLYEILAHDFIYPNPLNIMIFADNHDVTRFHRDTDKSLDRFKLGMAFLLTTRGIPQIYYGTEILMTGTDENLSHGKLRKDFPGGWPTDKRNAFTPEGRTKKENEAWNYLQKILLWRKTASAIHNGKLTHFIPRNNTYVYFRHNQQQELMIILHSEKTARTINLERFSEFLDRHPSGIDIISGKQIDFTKKDLYLEPRSAMIIELK
ncbi:MAG TPA: glycoside hydrolase family 13 protein [Salinivirgaceae bacterium]|nr:glycoside hydrolase family 13 protein [Salinivirgaceae bacterium]